MSLVQKILFTIDYQYYRMTTTTTTTTCAPQINTDMILSLSQSYCLTGEQTDFLPLVLTFPGIKIYIMYQRLRLRVMVSLVEYEALMYSIEIVVYISIQFLS